MVELAGPLGQPRVVLDPTGIALAAPSIRIAGALQPPPFRRRAGTDPPSGVNIDTGGKPFCINGHAVVLEEFIATIYASHVHVTGSPNTGTPVPARPAHGRPRGSQRHHEVLTMRDSILGRGA